SQVDITQLTVTIESKQPTVEGLAD
ncbi:MAG: hypothetical protein ACI9PZ_003104, partial [Parvicella sp.]